MSAGEAGGGAGYTGGIVEAYRRALPPGPEAEFKITGLDHLEVPVWSAALWPDSGPFTNGIGYGTTREAARTSAYGEMFEAVNAWRAISSMPRVRGSYEELVLERGRRGVLDPREACLTAGSAFTPQMPLQWVAARRYPDGGESEEVLVPVELAATRFADLGGSPAPNECLTTPITNGLGAGPSLAHALSHALLELVQRDGNSVSYRALDRGVAVDISGATDPQVLSLLRTLDAGGVDVTVKLAETDLGMANFYAVGEDTDPTKARHPLAVTACGEAAHPDREVALRKCLAEFCAARSRKPFNHGPLGPIYEISPPGYVERFRESPLGSEEDRSLEATLDWLSMSYPELRELVADPILAVNSRVPLSEVPTTPVDESAPDYRERLLDTVVDRLSSADLEVLYLDLSPKNSEDPEDGEARTVKAIVPGLEVETLSYGRIGPRNLRRLLERGSDLVVTGDPERPPGARRILLTPEKEEELGPTWLDYEAVDRTVGELYPLYREPGRHVAALAAESRGAVLSAAAPDNESGLRYAYNTNGAQNHRLDDALALISEAGYDGVALTLDHHHLDPFTPGLADRSDRLSDRLSELGLGIIIETGARFLLDPRHKHEPTLLTPDPEGRKLRLEFLYRALEVAAATGAEAVSFWAGVPRAGQSPGESWKLLEEGVGLVAERASELGVTAALEPEPGMLAETPDDYTRLAGGLKGAGGLSLALDTGHCLVTGEREPEGAVREFAGSLGTVSIEDMARGVHEHLPFGEGDMDLPAVLGALREVGFGGLVCVELSRESHWAHVAIPESLAALESAEDSIRTYGQN